MYQDAAVWTNFLNYAQSNKLYKTLFSLAYEFWFQIYGGWNDNHSLCVFKWKHIMHLFAIVSKERPRDSKWYRSVLIIYQISFVPIAFFCHRKLNVCKVSPNVLFITSWWFLVIHCEAMTPTSIYKPLIIVLLQWHNINLRKAGEEKSN